MKKAKSLLVKLKQVAESIPYVEKRGHNDEDGYHYQKASDVARIFRAELFKRNVLLTTDEKEISERQVETNGGAPTWVTTLKVEFTFHDIDSEQTLTRTGFGSGCDRGDKGLYKAKTGAMKYMLRGLGLVPDERDDPEYADYIADQVSQGKEPDYKGLKVVDYQVRAFDSACHRSGKTAQQIATYLQTKFKKVNVLDLNREEFTEAMKWAVADDEALADTLQTSLDALQSITDNLKTASRKKGNHSEASKAAGPAIVV